MRIFLIFEVLASSFLLFQTIFCYLSMSKKGLSLEEKRTRLLDLFKESKEFYKLQELEKIAPKLKGITSMSVKDVLQELVNDNLVKFDKIGIMNFYWCFPNDMETSIVNQKIKLESSIEQLLKLKETEVEGLKREKAEREESAERTEMLVKIEEARKVLEGLELENAKYITSDPKTFAKKEELISKMQTIALNWTDNISSALCYFRDNHGHQARDQLKASLDIEDDFEDLNFV